MSGFHQEEFPAQANTLQADDGWDDDWTPPVPAAAEEPTFVSEKLYHPATALSQQTQTHHVQIKIASPLLKTKKTPPPPPPKKAFLRARPSMTFQVPLPLAPSQSLPAEYEPHNVDLVLLSNTCEKVNLSNTRESIPPIFYQDSVMGINNEQLAQKFPLFSNV